MEKGEAYTHADLRRMAAALETPDDLTELELSDAHEEIIELLLSEADYRESFGRN